MILPKKIPLKKSLDLHTLSKSKPNLFKTKETLFEKPDEISALQTRAKLDVKSTYIYANFREDLWADVLACKTRDDNPEIDDERIYNEFMVETLVEFYSAMDKGDHKVSLFKVRQIFKRILNKFIV